MTKRINRNEKRPQLKAVPKEDSVESTKPRISYSDLTDERKEWVKLFHSIPKEHQEIFLRLAAAMREPQTRRTRNLLKLFDEGKISARTLVGMF